MPRKLFSFNYGDREIELLGSSWSGKEWLLIDGKAVSVNRSFRLTSEHHFILDGEELILRFLTKMREGTIEYSLHQDDELLHHDEVAVYKEMVDRFFSQTADKNTGQNNKKLSKLLLNYGIFGLLFKSPKILKALLAAISVAGWSFWLSWQVGVILVLSILVHEWGHLWAMKHFGLKTKGIYLIPMLGGVAISEQARSHWQSAMIALAGPFIGVVASLACFGVYALTDWTWAATAGSLGLTLNIFNLLPVYPMDGGRVVKALVFSAPDALGLFQLFICSVALLALSIWQGFFLIAFFLVIGLFDLIVDWKHRAQDQLTPMNDTAYLACILAYLGLIGFIVWISIRLQDMPGIELFSNLLSA